MKRMISILIAIALSVAIAPVAFAHGHHGGRIANNGYARAPAVCAVESCTLVGTHTHDGATYYAHYYGDGHAYHDYCGIADCTITGYHEHDGAYCFGHTAYDGHGYHTVGGYRHH